MEQEIKFLRHKVKELEATVAFIQCEVRDKLGFVLEQFFNYRADQIAKQQRTLKEEDEICRDFIISSSNLFDGDHGTPSKPQTGVAAKRRRKRNRNSSGENGASRMSAPTSRRTQEVRLQEYHASSHSTPSNDEDEFHDGDEISPDDEDEGYVVRIKTEPRDHRSEAAAKVELMMQGDADEGEDQSGPGHPMSENIGGMSRVFEEFKPQRATSVKPSTVWKYFLREVNGQFAKCRVDNCGKVFHNRQSTSSLRTHLKRVHRLTLPGKGQGKSKHDILEPTKNTKRPRRRQEEHQHQHEDEGDEDENGNGDGEDEGETMIIP